MKLFRINDFTPGKVYTKKTNYLIDSLPNLHLVCLATCQALLLKYSMY